MARSTLGAFWDCPNERTGRRRMKGAEFVRWGKAVIAWVRERCTESLELHGFAYPATPGAAAVADLGEVWFTH